LGERQRAAGAAGLREPVETLPSVSNPMRMDLGEFYELAQLFAKGFQEVSSDVDGFTLEKPEEMEELRKKKA